MDESFFDFRTDMADERVDTYKRINNLTDIDGISVKSDTDNGFKTTVVEVINENGKRALKKEIGKYITIEFDEVEYMEENIKQSLVKNLADQIKLLSENKFSKILIVGLGNENITPDALGPKVVSFINITRHLLRYAKELVTDPVNEISAISPGVLGTTGIETEEIVEAIVSIVKPDIVIAIDSLASMSIERVGRTIQLSNTGITPGQGVGNTRNGLNEKTLSTKVIAIGVPMVVDMATITNDVIEKIATVDNKYSYMIGSSEERYSKISKMLDSKNYIVTPKEIDVLIDKISEIIANGINEAI